MGKVLPRENSREESVPCKRFTFESKSVTTALFQNRFSLASIDRRLAGVIPDAGFPHSHDDDLIGRPGCEAVH